MTDLNCPNCRKRTTFSDEDKNKFKCKQCSKLFSQCKINQCSNLINLGVVCKECVGKGLKNGGAAGSILLFTSGVALKVLKKGK